MVDWRRSRGRAPWRRFFLVAIPLAGTSLWALYVTLSGQWSTVAGHWDAFVTMIFGSFVAGSTPQGGGTVAFPVFTKLFDTPAAVARTFSLCIQALGMTSAALAILISGKSVSRRAILVGAAAAIAGFLAGIVLLSDPASPFLASRLPEPYVKVTFTVVLAALAYVVYLALDEGECGVWFLPFWNRRIWGGLLIAGFVGGVTSSLIGSGADVFVFLFIVIIAGLHPRIGVPTSVVVMAIVSIFGLVHLGVVEGQLSTEVVDGMVVAVGGTAIAPLPAAQADLWGLWLASAPAVIWGAPLGTVFVHGLRERHLIVFLVLASLAEVVTTAIFLEELHTNRLLLLYGVGGLAVAIGAVTLLHRLRDPLLGSAAPSLVEQHIVGRRVRVNPEAPGGRRRS